MLLELQDQIVNFKNIVNENEKASIWIVSYKTILSNITNIISDIVITNEEKLSFYIVQFYDLYYLFIINLFVAFNNTFNISAAFNPTFNYINVNYYQIITTISNTINTLSSIISELSSLISDNSATNTLYLKIAEVFTNFGQILFLMWKLYQLSLDNSSNDLTLTDLFAEFTIMLLNYYS